MATKYDHLFSEDSATPDLGVQAEILKVKVLNIGMLEHYWDYLAEIQAQGVIGLELSTGWPEGLAGSLASALQAVPVHELEEESISETQKDIMQIKLQKPDIVWIGLGGEKQTLLMYNYHEKLGCGLMIGVGAVFDYFVGNIHLSPNWVKNIGLRWLYRLIQQPWLIKKYIYLIKYTYLYTNSYKLEYRIAMFKKKG